MALETHPPISRRLAPAGQSRAPRHRLSLLVVLSVLGSGALSCGGDTTTGLGSLSPAQTYWALQLNQHAVQLALVPPYNTLQLTATPLNAIGTPLNGLGPATFTTTDSNVSVSPTGLVTARYATSPGGTTSVIASFQAQNVTLTDTVRIQVTDTAPQHQLATFTIQPAQGDSAKRSLDFEEASCSTQFCWPVTALNTVGDTVCNANTCALPVYYTSSNPTVATIDAMGQVTVMDTGHTVFTATTLAYGVAMRDSVTFTIGYQLKYSTAMTLSDHAGVLTLGFVAPKTLVLGVGAVVTFDCRADANCGHPVDVIFDDSAEVDTASINGFVIPVPPNGSGNIPAFGGDTLNSAAIILIDFRARRFPVAGTYRYHSALFPSDTNTLIIKKD